ncbi:hypothetical protein FOXG_13888 [Fusarium oxysporum f. sp. lycopersici 4287]|uniref:Uncharacterized protein n=2 Tax=Fusarium oxysporum TaxID=5507 RepID=A0A0J9VXI6_FUSO4|nr:hypothetical protein FOXG_13888 [Fusarium oxysporum f. sp. lycopersici 4287]EXK35013.1 hypothetical protein FOMG_10300 [Fusarium oxysporum f. sp. melonis 26406]KNB15265.1 hypothetical protein FOXG_13888 [Fusarium oxysporum f. sp. lycopersici 4287]
MNSGGQMMKEIRSPGCMMKILRRMMKESGTSGQFRTPRRMALTGYRLLTPFLLAEMPIQLTIRLKEMPTQLMMRLKEMSLKEPMMRLHHTRAPTSQKRGSIL